MRPKGVIVYQSDCISARYVEAGSEQVVVSFPDRIHPLGSEHVGWGENFLTKRGISGIYIALTETNWFQCPDFFEAMYACRDFLGPDVPVTSYGSSMGGYGAILAAKTLRATLCVALSPQFSIDLQVAPFERRYLEFSHRIGPFLHNISEEVDLSCDYVIAYDPLHRRDRQHVCLLSQYFPLFELPVYCAGHGVLSVIQKAGGLDCLADVLRKKAHPRDVRRCVRGQRWSSKRYFKKMATRVKERGHNRLFDFEGGIHSVGNRTIAKVTKSPKVKVGRRPQLIVHCGLPKTGTSSLQAYFFSNADRYLLNGIFYPTRDANKRDFNHAWFSKGLRDASVGQLYETLVNIPEGTETIFLSDESLFVELPGLTDQAREMLSAVIEGFDIRLLIFEREKAAWMRSFYLQSIQNRRSDRITPHETARNLWQTPLDYEAFFAQPYCQKLLDFDAMRAELSQVFSQAAVTVLPFEKGKDVVQEFCAAMSWPYMGEGQKLMFNPSITDSQAEILRQANGHSSLVGRFIKQLIELPENFDAAGLRAKRREKLIVQAREFPWTIFKFRTNPPLEVTPESFRNALEGLRSKAARLGDFRDEAT